MARRVIVTRPRREALQWVQALVLRGWMAEALPLIAIAPVQDPQPVQAAWHELPRCMAVMFVSANAVEHFFAARPAQVAWGGARAWATGPGTAQALQAAGVAPADIDAPSVGAPQFDSEALWQIVGQMDLPGRLVLIVRGADDAGHTAGRPWLAERLLAAGAAVREVAAYQRSAPRWGPAEQAHALAGAQDGAIWLFSSSDALRHLAALLPGTDWQAACAVATHARVAEAARSLGFGRVVVAQPNLETVAASIESLQ